MSNASNIKSLAALRERREEIAAEQEAAKKGLTSSLAQAPAKAKDYALEDLAIPALGIGLAAYIGYRVIRSGKSDSTDRSRIEQPMITSAPVPDANQQRIPVSPPVAARPPKPASRPVVANYQRPVQPERPAVSRETKKGMFNLATVVAAGKLLIPAAQAIIGVVQSQQTKQQTKEQLEETKEHIEATV